MRTSTISTLFLCAAIGGPALAADEPKPAAAEATAPAPATPDPVHATAPAAPAAASADAAKAADVAAAARAKETDRRLRNEGYKPTVMNGVTYYCRNQVETGSHLPGTRSCATPEDIEQIARDSKEVTEKMQFIRTQQAK